MASAEVSAKKQNDTPSNSLCYNYFKIHFIKNFIILKKYFIKYLIIIILKI